MKVSYPLWSTIIYIAFSLSRFPVNRPLMSCIAYVFSLARNYQNNIVIERYILEILMSINIQRTYHNLPLIIVYGKKISTKYGVLNIRVGYMKLVDKM